MSYSGSMMLPTATATTSATGKIERSSRAIFPAYTSRAAVPTHSTMVATVCIVVLSSSPYGGAGG